MVIAACAINFVAQGIVLGVQAIDYFRYNASGHVVGILFAGFGLGALAGAIVAQQLTQNVPLLKLAAVAIVAMPLPLFLLSPTTPWPAATIIIAGFAFFTPLVNAPVIGLLTVRTPAELRPKVMTAVMTVATMAGPFGFIAAGYLLRHVSLGSFFIGLPALLALGGLAFAGVLLRHQRGETGDLAVANG
jgi:predicted MFS family arabinose efflux permease